MSTPLPSTRPGTVTASFMAWLVAIVIGFATAVLLFVSAGAAVVADQSSPTADFFGITFVFSGLIVLFFTVVELAVVFRMRSGRNWARITLTFIALLQIVNAVFSVGLNGIISAAGSAVVIVAAVLMWLPASNRYFGRLPTRST